MGCGESKSTKTRRSKRGGDVDIGALERVLYGGHAAIKWKKKVAEKNAVLAKKDGPPNESLDGSFYREKNAVKYGRVRPKVRDKMTSKQNKKK